MSKEERCEESHVIKLEPDNPKSKSTRTLGCQRLKGHNGSHSDILGNSWE